jgi:uncharacterized protein
MHFRILSIDGGGTRGVLPASFLAELQRRGMRLQDSFDLVVGTSTGGIIALALAYQADIEAVVQLYMYQSSVIFRKARLLPILGSWYSNHQLIRHLKDLFGEARTCENPNCEIRVQAYKFSVR